MSALKDNEKIKYETSDVHSAEAYLQRLLNKGCQLEQKQENSAQ